MSTTTPRRTARPVGAVYPGRPVRPKKRWKRIALLAAALVGVIALFVGGCLYQQVDALDARFNRTDPFAGITGGRPPVTVEGAMNILVLGSDSRDGEAYDPKKPGLPHQGVEGERTDSIMLVHIPEDQSKAQVISIPRDTYVTIPAYQGKAAQRAKINGAFARGGTTLAVMAVEKFTGVRVDHTMKIDFNGFKKMTDALGGVTVFVNETTTDPRSKRTFRQGHNTLNGDAALDYVRQRYALPGGDFDRVKRQQVFIRAIMQKATESGTLTDIPKLKKFLNAAADSVTVDEGFKLGDMALQFRKLRPDDLTFITTPNLGSQNINGSSVVVADKAKAGALFDAVAADKVDQWIAANPPGDAKSGR